MGLEDRNMEPDETAFIVNSEGKTCEIVGGRNVSFEDGYAYTLSQDGETVYQVGEKGLIDGEYTFHPSAETIQAILNPPSVMFGPR